MKNYLSFLFMAGCAMTAGATNESTAPLTGEVPLAAYLDGLKQMAPAAHDGAEAYLAAFKQRCGRAMTVLELRRAVADGTGEPVLMAMMRAASLRDTPALQRLANAVPCTKRP